MSPSTSSLFIISTETFLEMCTSYAVVKSFTFVRFLERGTEIRPTCYFSSPNEKSSFACCEVTDICFERAQPSV